MGGGQNYQSNSKRLFQSSHELCQRAHELFHLLQYRQRFLTNLFCIFCSTTFLCHCGILTDFTVYFQVEIWFFQVYLYLEKPKKNKCSFCKSKYLDRNVVLYWSSGLYWSIDMWFIRVYSFCKESESLPVQKKIKMKKYKRIY